MSRDFTEEPGGGHGTPPARDHGPPPRSRLLRNRLARALRRRLECARIAYAAAFADFATELERGYDPAHRFAVQYRHPARFGDRLLVEVRTDDDPRPVFAFRYRIVRRDGGGLLATARTVQALVGPRGLLVGWPPRARALLAALRAHEATLPAW